MIVSPWITNVLPSWFLITFSTVRASLLSSFLAAHSFAPALSRALPSPSCAAARALLGPGPAGQRPRGPPRGSHGPSPIGRRRRGRPYSRSSLVRCSFLLSSTDRASRLTALSFFLPSAFRAATEVCLSSQPRFLSPLVGPRSRSRRGRWP